MRKEIEGIVQIGSKPVVERHATATGLLHLSATTVTAIQEKSVKKGYVLEASTIAAFKPSKTRHGSSPTAIQSLSKAVKSHGSGRETHCGALYSYPLITKLALKWRL